MKLTALEPQPLTVREKRFGFTFLCPCGCRDRLSYYCETDSRWRRISNNGSFENLSIVPKIQIGHWKGFINNGEVY